MTYKGKGIAEHQTTVVVYRPKTDPILQVLSIPKMLWFMPEFNFYFLFPFFGQTLLHKLSDNSFATNQ